MDSLLRERLLGGSQASISQGGVSGEGASWGGKESDAPGPSGWRIRTWWREEMQSLTRIVAIIRQVTPFTSHTAPHTLCTG